MKPTRAETDRAGMLAGLEAGHAQARIDARLAAEREQARDVGMMPLADVLGRPGGLDTREPKPEAVEALAESIDALGLLEPLVVDRLGALLAGKTRLLALRRLQRKAPERWDRVPVRRMPFIAADEPAAALAVEVAENEQRRAYTPGEVKALAERLKAAGFRATRGRPRKGQKALLPTLGAVVGMSKRALLYMLEDEAAAPEKVQDCTFFEKTAAKLARPLDALAGADCPPGSARDRAAALARELAALLPEAVEESRRGDA
jgi:ParB family transcriptional regulator, chromosome partitioning protein